MRVFGPSCIVAFLLLFPRTSDAQDVREYVKDTPAGDRVSVTISPQHPSLDIQGLMRFADLVVEGVLDKPVSAVTKDQRFISTTHSMRVTRVFFSRQAGTSVPGPGISTLMVSQLGGQATIDGKVLEESDSTLPLFSPGIRLVLFLKMDSADPGVYQIVGGPYGTFGVQNGRVRSFLQTDKEMKQRYDGVDLDTFQALVRSAVEKPAKTSSPQ
jgi:hypothetical protein